MEHFIPVDPLWLDIQRIRLWPTYCDKKHGGFCHRRSEWETIDPPPSMMLIDVNSQLLVQVSQPKKYIALSYVWGELVPGVLETKKCNISQLQNVGALDSQPWAATMPKTVRDAMRFTKSMGEQYLWVDRLCIVQDDMEHKTEQLSWMSSIYANSYFTIIAADGDDANYGLRGIDTRSSPRSYHAPILQFSSTCSMMRAPETETQYNLKEWHKRGWTYQERTLSNRNLVFFQGKVFWECRQSVWTEELTDASCEASLPKSPRQNFDRYSFEFHRWPDLHQYARLVGSYNNRRLTHQSDGSQAFSAIINALSRSFQKGFVHGVPELYFDFGLLWRPNTPTRRRVGAKVETWRLPSWSWVGWEGNIVHSCLKKSHQLLWDNESFGPSINIHPMVTWYKVNKQTGEKCRIDNSYHSFQRMRKDPSIPLPAGWSRVKLSNSPDYPDDHWVFTHEDVPNTEFIHPVPIPKKPLTLNRDIWHNHLVFKTVHCFLFSGPLLEAAPQRAAWSNISNDFEMYCLSFVLVDDSGQWAGMIYSNFSNKKDIVLGQKCEVIIISAGDASVDKNESVKSWLEEWKCIDEIKNMDTYEFYNVLWIERNGDVAYRKALGRVWKTAWERQHVEEVDVTLG